MKNILFIGAGIMGKPMARNLVKAGYNLHLWARHPEKVADLVAEGAAIYPTVAEAVKHADVIITMLSEPKDVRGMYFGDENSEGLLNLAPKGIYLVDMTTSSPELAQELFAEGTKRGYKMVDAPVSGGEKGAIEGKLTIFVGGTEEDFNACSEMLSAMAARLTFFGPAGSGHHAKMVNQILVAGTLSGICESMTYARAAGLDMNKAFNAVSVGSCGGKQLDKIAPKIIAGDDTPSFFIRYLAKDLRIALGEAKRAGLNLEVLEQTLANLDDLIGKGMGNLGTQALAHHYEK